MSVVLWVALATLIGSAVVVVPILWSQVRARDRLERSLCGDCGIAFGKQEPRVWSDYGHAAPGSRRHLPVASGPLMRCPQCGKEWPYDRSGRPHLGPVELPVETA